MHRLSRRHVIATMTASTVMLCPALLRAQDDWGDIPTTEPIGEDQLLTVGAGPAQIEVSGLQPGEVAVVARPNDERMFSGTNATQYVAILRRTEAQIAFGQANDDAGAVQDVGYLVINLVCPHRGKALGMTGNPAIPFACTDRGGRHASDFNASGLGVAGASEGDWVTFPSYTIAASGADVVLTLS